MNGSLEIGNICVSLLYRVAFLAFNISMTISQTIDILYAISRAKVQGGIGISSTAYITGLGTNIILNKQMD